MSRTGRQAAGSGRPARPSRRSPQARRSASRSDRGTPRPQRADATLISACLIVKDEEKALPDCLASLRGLADEVVVYDTGSTDGTVDLARRAGARVIEGYWDDDFSRARNTSLDQCRGQWVLWIDADERFYLPNMAELRTVLRSRLDGDALAIEIYNLGDDPAASNINIHRALRMFRRQRCQWYGSIHEQVDLRPGQAAPLMVVPLKGAHIIHIGYQAEVVSERDKLARNLRLAQSALAKDVPIKGQEGVAELNVGRALAALARYEEAQPYFDDALARVVPGIATRASLLFSAQNLIQIGQFERAADQAAQFRELCQNKGLAYYLEGVARRRMGQFALAVELFAQVDEMSNEDGFVFPETLLMAERAGAFCDCGRLGEAADELVLLVEASPEVSIVRAALKVFAATGKSLEDLAAAMPENRLDKIAAALILVPPVVADPVAEALFGRFGAKPQLLAAAIRFAPMLAAPRALEWSARLRAIGMIEHCPLVAQAKIDVLEVPARLRAAVTAHAAFGDARGAELALRLAAGLHEDQLAPAVIEVSVLDPALAGDFAQAAAAPGAPDAGPVGSPSSRRQAVAEALAGLGNEPLSAQIRNETDGICEPALVVLS